MRLISITTLLVFSSSALGQTNCAELATVLMKKVKVESGLDLDYQYTQLLAHDWESLEKLESNKQAGGALESIAAFVRSGMTKSQWEQIRSRYLETTTIIVNDRTQISETFLTPEGARLVQKCLEGAFPADQQYWFMWLHTDSDPIATARVVYRPLKTSARTIKLKDVRVVGGDLIEEEWNERQLEDSDTLFIAVKREECHHGFNKVCISMSFSDGPPMKEQYCLSSTCDPPTPPTGACCLPDGNCMTTARNECSQRRGQYQGDNVKCTDCMCTSCTRKLVVVALVPRERRAGSDSVQELTVFFSRHDGSRTSKKIEWTPLNPNDSRSGDNTLEQGSKNTIIIRLDEAVRVDRITSIRWRNRMSTGLKEDSLKLSSVTVDAELTQGGSVQLFRAADFKAGWLDDERTPGPMGIKGPTLEFDIPVEYRR